MKFPARWLALIVWAALCSAANAQTYVREELRIPVPGAGSRGLEAVMVRPDLQGRLPLVIITHGTPFKRAEVRTRSPNAQLPIAVEFARRGWAAVIVMRRGHGGSGGEVADSRGSCQGSGIQNSGMAAAADLRASVLHLRARPDIDESRVLILGASTGGLAAIAATSDPPPGLLVAVNLAGGQMSDSCARSKVETNLTAAFAAFGKRSRVLTLWIYSENDKVFPPQLTQRLRETFVAQGGKVEFVSAPPFRSDGHALSSGQWVSEWMPYVDQFLKQHELVWLEKPLPPPPLPSIPPPQKLPESGRRSFDAYLAAPPNRAFALSSRGSYGWTAAQRTVEAAKKGALAGCAKHAADCRIVVVNDEAVP